MSGDMAPEARHLEDGDAVPGRPSELAEYAQPQQLWHPLKLFDDRGWQLVGFDLHDAVREVAPAVVDQLDDVDPGCADHPGEFGDHAWSVPMREREAAEAPARQRHSGEVHRVPDV